jgi:hypothetical protein
VTQSASSQPSYSVAFERFVQDDDDLIGLIAYALYKANIREAVISNQAVHTGSNRSPTSGDVAAYRGQAQTLLGEFAQSMIEQSKPQLIKAEFGSELESAKTEIVSAINGRTNFWYAILTNVVGWLISIAITLIVVLNGIPGWISQIANNPG